MISFVVDPYYTQDLRDDVIMNEEKKMYDFIGNDPVKAFYLGYNLEEWFPELEKDQKYLYSKDARHNKDDLEKYQNQIDYWIKQYSKPEDEVNLCQLAEYVMNNMIYDPDTEKSDTIKLAFFFGNLIQKQCKKIEKN